MQPYKLIIVKGRIAKISKGRFGIYLPKELYKLHGKEVILHIYYKDEDL